MFALRKNSQLCAAVLLLLAAAVMAQAPALPVRLAAQSSTAQQGRSAAGAIDANVV